MNRKSPLIQTPLKYGLIAAALTIALLTLLFYTNKVPLVIPFFMDARMLILPIFIFFAQREFRDYQNQGTLHFWQGLVIGFIVAGLIALCVAAFIHILLAYISPEFLQQDINARIEMVKNMIKSLENGPDLLPDKASLEDQVEQLNQTSSANLASDYFIKTMALGLFFNIIISVFLRQQVKTS